MARKKKKPSAIDVLPRPDRWRFLWAQVAGTVGFLVLVFVFHRYVHGKRDTGGALGWTLFGLGVAIIIIANVVSTSLFFKGRRIKRAQALEVPSEA